MTDTKHLERYAEPTEHAARIYRAGVDIAEPLAAAVGAPVSTPAAYALLRAAAYARVLAYECADLHARYAALEARLDVMQRELNVLGDRK